MMGLRAQIVSALRRQCFAMEMMRGIDVNCAPINDKQVVLLIQMRTN
jgi:hypothetical protein